MAMDYERLMATEIRDIEREYGDVEALLYAQSVGFGRDAVDRKELAYVYEQGDTLRTVPTLASAIVPDMFPPDLGWDYSQVLHVEQRLQLYRPMPAAAAGTALVSGGMILMAAKSKLIAASLVLFALVAVTTVIVGDGRGSTPPGWLTS